MKIDGNDSDLLVAADGIALRLADMTDDRDIIADNEEFVRLTLAQRIQRIVLFTAVFILALTGIPLVFPNAPFVREIFSFPSSFWLRGVIHRIAGVSLLSVGLFQIVYIIASPRGASDFHKVIPKHRDARDAIDLLLFKLGLREVKPKFGKFNFMEKFGYLAVAWGIVIMAVTGLTLWFQEASIALFPVWALDIFRTLHGFEAIFALLAIIIWHMCNVYLNPEIFPASKVWINGRISKKEMMERHPLEYEEILQERRERYTLKMVSRLVDEVRQQ